MLITESFFLRFAGRDGGRAWEHEAKVERINSLARGKVTGCTGLESKFNQKWKNQEKIRL